MESIIWVYRSMKKGILDNDYHFYEDGRILHFYDRTQNDLNNEVFVTADQIATDERIKILDQCPAELKDRVRSMLKL